MSDPTELKEGESALPDDVLEQIGDRRCRGLTQAEADRVERAAQEIAAGGSTIRRTHAGDGVAVLVQHRAVSSAETGSGAALVAPDTVNWWEKNGLLPVILEHPPVGGGSDTRGGPWLAVIHDGGPQ